MNTYFTRFATLIVAGVLTGGCKQEHVEVRSEATPVQLHVVQTGDVAAAVIASGAIESVGKSDIAFMVSGRVISVDVEDGATVTGGEILARLDPVDYEKSLAIAEAQLQEVEARHARLSRMHEAGSLTDTEFDRIDAALKQARAAAGLARQQLDYTVLRAPFDGSIVKHKIETGVVVAPAVPVFTLHSPGAVWANLGVSEVDIGRIQIGQTASVQVAAARTEHVGRVEAILPDADTLSRAFTVKVRLENPTRELRHGNVVTGRVQTGTARTIVSVPPQTVQKNPDGSLFVWMFDSERQTAIRQIVETGALQTNHIEITSGLKAGDRVILNVPFTLFEGAPLTVAE